MIDTHDSDPTNPASATSPEEASPSSGFLSHDEALAPDAPLTSGPTSWRFWLASASPRRSELLQNIGLPFTVLPNTFEEPEPNAEDEANPAQYVEALARAKAAACDTQSIFGDDLQRALAKWPDVRMRHLIITADTIVWHNGHILNKPRDAEDARRMLSDLRGRTHQVFTGICLRRLVAPKYFEGAQEAVQSEEKYFVAHQSTTVRFRAASDAWIEAYAATDEPHDKAGAYAAQGMGATLIEAIEGDYFNVVGLPLSRLAQMLEQLGAPIESFWKLKIGT